MKPDTCPGAATDPCLEPTDLVALIEGFAGYPTAGQPLATARARLLQRVQEASIAAQAFSTVRLRQQCATSMAPGVVARTLYAGGAAALRAGEPRCAMLVELAAGSVWVLASASAGAVRREWLLIEGDANIDGMPLHAGSYHVSNGCGGSAALQSLAGGWAYLRETPVPASTPATTYTQHDCAALWLAFAPGIQRRLLWQQGQEGAMLYRAQAGATVPAHGHGHDEECLMLEGEVFLDDVLLRRGEYQIAPAGSRHSGVFTDTGALIYAHGDSNLALL